MGVEQGTLYNRVRIYGDDGAVVIKSEQPKISISGLLQIIKYNVMLSM